MKTGCFVPLVAIVLIIGGGQYAYTGLTNRKPTQVEMSSLVNAKPTAKWLNIKGGELDLINASYSSAFGVGDASTIHVPLTLPGEDSSESTIHVLVETKDAELVKLINEIREMEKQTLTEEQMLKFMIENRDKLRKARQVKGLVKYGMDKGKQEDKVQSMYSNLAPDVILIKEGVRPDAMVGIFMFIAGVVIAVFIFKQRGKPDQNPTSGNPPPLPGSGTPPPLPPNG
jgi:hypothetical protein